MKGFLYLRRRCIYAKLLLEEYKIIVYSCKRELGVPFKVVQKKNHLAVLCCKAFHHKLCGGYRIVTHHQWIHYPVQRCVCTRLLWNKTKKALIVRSSFTDSSKEIIQQGWALYGYRCLVKQFVELDLNRWSKHTSVACSFSLYCLCVIGEDNIKTWHDAFTILAYLHVWKTLGLASTSSPINEFLCMLITCLWKRIVRA